MATAIMKQKEVPEMGKLLGLKKTDRYWLVHKNVFESKEIAGKIRINIASFEKWYANQIKYHKVTGEEPGKELKSWSYSVKEIADLLGVDDYLVYELLKKNQMEAVIVDYWKHIPKESFQNQYKSQSRYRTKEDREKDDLLEDATITMPEMAQLLGTTRSSVYTILDSREKVKNLLKDANENGVKLSHQAPTLYDVVPKEEIAEFEELMRKTIADIVSEASSIACWVYVQKYVKQKTLDEMLQELPGAGQFIIVMDNWFERLMAE